MANKFDPNSIANVYLFYGTEAYKRRNYKERLKSLIAGPGSMNYAAYEGKNIDFNAVYENAVTLPFFAEKRLIIIENSEKFKARKKKKNEESDEANAQASNGQSTSEQQQSNQAKTNQIEDSPNPANGESPKQEDESVSDALIEKLIADLPSTTCLAIFETEVTKTKKTYKLIEKHKFGQIIECNPDTPETVIKWLAKGFAAAHKKIRQSTAQLIIDRVGTDYDMLRQEYEKIIAYAGDSDEITDEDVLAVCSEDIEDKIFWMLDAICNRNPEKVLEHYYGLVANKIAPLYILAMIRIQFRAFLQVVEQANTGANAYDIASYTKKQDFVVKKYLKFARYFKVERLEEILDKISETEYQIKSGNLGEQIGVEMMLVEFSG